MEAVLLRKELLEHLNASCSCKFLGVVLHSLTPFLRPPNATLNVADEPSGLANA